MNQATEVLEKAKREKEDVVTELRTLHAIDLQAPVFEAQCQVVQTTQQAEALVRERNNELAHLAASPHAQELQMQAQAERIVSVCLGA